VGKHRLKEPAMPKNVISGYLDVLGKDITYHIEVFCTACVIKNKTDIGVLD
jgi:hypothetical protein